MTFCLHETLFDVLCVLLPAYTSMKNTHTEFSHNLIKEKPCFLKIKHPKVAVLNCNTNT